MLSIDYTDGTVNIRQDDVNELGDEHVLLVLDGPYRATLHSCRPVVSFPNMPEGVYTVARTYVPTEGVTVRDSADSTPPKPEPAKTTPKKKTVKK